MPSQWLLKKDIDRWKESCREKICLPVRVSSPGKKQVEEKPTYSAYLVSWLGKCAVTQARSPQLHSVVVALGICCGFKRLWGYASASQKSHKQNSGEEKKKGQKQLILLEKLLAFSYVCHNFLWYFLVLWSEKSSFHIYYCCFCQGCWWYSACRQTHQGAARKITSHTCWKAFQETTG